MKVITAYVFDTGEIALSVDEELALAVKEMLALLTRDYDIRIRGERRRIADAVESINRIDIAVDEYRIKMQKLVPEKPEEEDLVELFEDGKKEEKNE